MKKQYEDDGRTLADMSGVEKPRLMSDLFQGERKSPGHSSDSGKNSPWSEHVNLDSEEKRAAVLGMLKAGLMIGLIYIGVFAGVIALLIFLWRR